MPIAIIQARMNSTRLPGKVMMPIAGKPILQHVIERVEKSDLIDGILISTGPEETNWQIRDCCFSCGHGCYFGSEQDVLSRFITTVKQYHELAPCNHPVDYIVRICADSPLIRPDCIDELMTESKKRLEDYYAYALWVRHKEFLPVTQWPNGYFPELVPYRTLKILNDWLPPDDPRREHVTSAISDTNLSRHLLPLPDWYRAANYPMMAIDTMDDYLRVKKHIEDGGE